MERVTIFLSKLFVFVFLLTGCIHSFAQKADSAALAQKHITDSIQAANKRRADSLRFLRDYRQTKHYKDSVEFDRQKRFAEQAAARKHTLDSITAERKRIADSTMQVRKRYADSVRNYNDSVRTARMKILEEQKRLRKIRTDSLNAIRKYRESKHYKDSVQTVREERRAQLARERKHYSDSVRAVQRAKTDSMIAVRKAYNDSLKTVREAEKAVRMAQLDSLKAFRAARADSLAQVRKARAELRKQKAMEKEKARQDKMKLALEVKIKNKQAKYSNEDMRKKKWSLPRQVMQNTFTRYNYYFNANKKMEEAEANMVRSHTNNYDTLITLFPFDPDLDSTKLKTDMDTIIHKASLGIQIHDPRAKWQDDLYLLLGQAFYYKGDYQNAGASFKTIVAQAEQAKKEELRKKNLSKEERNKPRTFSDADKEGIGGLFAHTTAKNDALLWLSRVLTQNHKEGQAQTVLDLLDNDANFPERLRGRLALEQAFIDLKNNNFTKAAKSLGVVAEDKTQKDWLRQRAAFLNAQILQSNLNFSEADKYFNLALHLNPSLEMEFYAKKNIALNTINNGTGTYTADNLLEKMSKDGKFRPYYDQIFYAMGKAALKNKQGDKALSLFKQSVEASKSNKKQKGFSYAALGDEYYNKSDYINAKNAYDSAAAFLTIAEDPVYSLALKRAQALDLVAVPGTVVKEQDSLLRLSAMAEKDQRKYINDYLKDLERHLRDSIFRAQNTTTPVVPVTPNVNGSTTVTWYFANPNLMKRGENDFKQKWGSRPLKDNWRVSSSNNSSFESGDADAGNNGQEDNLNLPDEDTLYAAIPHTPEEIAKAKATLEQGLFDLGKAYYSNLEDYGRALETFDTLDIRFPNGKNAAEETYLRYLINMRQNNPAKAATYNKTLQQKYPDSEWAKLLSGQSQDTDVNPFANISESKKQNLSRFYDETYAMLMQRQYNDVLIRIKDADANYKNQGDFRKKFTLMKAVAIAGNGNFPEADTMLKQFVSANPHDSLTSWANAVLAFMNQHPELDKTPKPLTMPNGTDSTGNNGSDSSKTGADSAKSTANTLDYLYKPTIAHYVIISGHSEAKFSGLRSGLSDYNLMNADYSAVSATMSTLDADKSLIVCKSFNNAAEAKKYLNNIKKVSVLFREFKPGDLDMMLISAENFPKLFIKKDYENYKAFFNKYYK